MRLNIETVDAQNTLAILKRHYYHADVTIETEYPKTATFNIADFYDPTQESCYPLEGLIALGDYIPIDKIRIL